MGKNLGACLIVSSGFKDPRISAPSAARADPGSGGFGDDMRCGFDAVACITAADSCGPYAPSLSSGIRFEPRGFSTWGSEGLPYEQNL